MHGGDIERMLSIIDAIKDATHGGVCSVAAGNSYQLKTKCNGENCIACPTKTCAGNTTQEIPVPIGNPMDSIWPVVEQLKDDQEKMGILNSNMYTGTTNFNNSVGSPWKEIDKLMSVAETAKAYADGNNPFNWVSQKASMLAHLNALISYAIDAEYALTIYHDYVQRGYDHKFNGDTPSFTWKQTIDETTIGNMKQDYSENVNV